jgi:hypothetical protein
MGVVYACALSFMSKYLHQSCGPKPMTRVTSMTTTNIPTTILHLMQLYAAICNLCNYIATYATILQLYETILQQFRMQLYATMQHALCYFPKNLYATI